MSWDTCIVCDSCGIYKSFTVHGCAGDRLAPDSARTSALFVGAHLGHNNLRILHDYDVPDKYTREPSDW